MRFVCSVSDARDAAQAVEELMAPIDGRVTPDAVNLLWLFSTAHFEDELEDVIAQLRKMFPSALMLGCTGEGTIGGDRELERMPSMSLLVGTLPGVDVRPFHLTQGQLEGAESQFDWERLVGAAPESKPVFLSLVDPFRFDVHSFVERLNEFFPGAPLLGGVASAGNAPRENRLILDGELYDEGAVGVALSGALDVATVVSQGCRPIAQPFVITKGGGNVILELGGKPVLEQLNEVVSGLSEQDENLARQALFLGRVIDEHKSGFTRGDFLIQNILGFDRKSGAVGIAGHARIGATVQFHVRDAACADEDLRKLLAPHADKDVRGALLFGCNGRGTHMWPEPHHDVTVMREILGEVPLAGFFCGGEFGPVGGRNFIHGYTASIALFREPRDEDATHA